MVAPCKPLTKDHLPLKTTFPGTKGWSLVTGFTVPVFHGKKSSPESGGIQILAPGNDRTVSLSRS